MFQPRQRRPRPLQPRYYDSGFRDYRDDYDYYGYRNYHRYPVPTPRAPHSQIMRNLGWDLDSATAFLIKHLESNQSAAARSITKARAAFHTRGGRRTLLHKAFNDLDTHLFAGKLKDVVSLEWASLGQYVCGATHAPGPFDESVLVQLNIDLLLHSFADEDQVFSSLIHQMIHAYYLITCKAPEQVKADDLLTHGNHFFKIMHEIIDLSTVDGTRPLPQTYGQKLLQRQYRSRIGYYGSSYWSNPVGTLSGADGCSHCPAHQPMPPKTEVDSWYHDKCKPKLIELELSPSVYKLNDKGFQEIPRSEAGPREESVELVWQDKPILVSRSKIDSHASFKKHFSANKRVLQLPDVPEPILKALITFITTKSYPPDLSAVQDAKSKPPPRIEKPIKEWPPYLLTDIRVHKLAQQLSFDELTTHALHRLNNQHLTHEDPVAVLAEIYTSQADKDKDTTAKTPDTALRDWAKAFLHRYTPPQPLCTPLSTSNLHKLKHDPALCAAFADLCVKSPELQLDVQLVQSRLEELPAVPPPPVPPMGMGMPQYVAPDAYWQGGVYGGGAPAYGVHMLHTQLPPTPPPLQPHRVLYPQPVEPVHAGYGEWAQERQSGEWTPPKFVNGKWERVNVVTGQVIVSDGGHWRAVGAGGY